MLSLCFLVKFIMTIRSLKERDLRSLKELFCSYYEELGCDDDPLPLFTDCVAPDWRANLLSIAVAEEGEKLCGFIIFQIDDVINDWCFAEGKGDIREIYVGRSERRKGLGKALLLFAENALKNTGAKEVYLLPTDESEGFFISCGYKDIGDYCAELDCKVFGKDL